MTPPTKKSSAELKRRIAAIEKKFRAGKFKHDDHYSAAVIVGECRIGAAASLIGKSRATVHRYCNRLLWGSAYERVPHDRRTLGNNRKRHDSRN